MARKIDTTYQARMDGMARALEIAEKDGIEALRKQIEFRNVYFVPLEISRKDALEIYGLLSMRVLQTFMILAKSTLREKWGFAKKRLEEFQEHFDHLVECVDALDPEGQHYARISDYAKMLKEECDVDSDLKTLLKIEEENDKKDRENGRTKR